MPDPESPVGIIWGWAEVELRTAWENEQGATEADLDHAFTPELIEELERLTMHARG